MMDDVIKVKASERIQPMMGGTRFPEMLQSGIDGISTEKTRNIRILWVRNNLSKILQFSVCHVQAILKIVKIGLSFLSYCCFKPQKLTKRNGNMHPLLGSDNYSKENCGCIYSKCNTFFRTVEHRVCLQTMLNIIYCTVKGWYNHPCSI